MGLFNKEYCVICGKKAGMLGEKLKDKGKICFECSRKFSVFVDDALHKDGEYLWGEQEVRHYLQYHQKSYIIWKHFCEMDLNLKNKLERLMDRLYFCEEYGFFIAGDNPFEVPKGDSYDLFFVDQIKMIKFDFVPGTKKRTIGRLILNVVVDIGYFMTIPVLMDTDQQAFVMCDLNEVALWNGYQNYWIEETEKIEAKLSRFKWSAYSRIPDDKLDENITSDHIHEKSLGLFMLDEKQPYDVNYLAHVRNGLIQIYGSKAEIDQAYDHLMKQIGTMSADENTGETVQQVCSKCGHQNPNDARFCENCGMILK